MVVARLAGESRPEAGSGIFGSLETGPEWRNVSDPTEKLPTPRPAPKRRSQTPPDDSQTIYYPKICCALPLAVGLDPVNGRTPLALAPGVTLVSFCPCLASAE